MHLCVDVGGILHPGRYEHPAAHGRIAAIAAIVQCGEVQVPVPVGDVVRARGVLVYVRSRKPAVPVVSAVVSVDTVGRKGKVVVISTVVPVGTYVRVVCYLCEVLHKYVGPQGGLRIGRGQ